MQRVLGFFILLSSVQLQFVLSQNIQSCSEYFTYEQLGGVIYGKLTLPAISIPRKIDMLLSQRGVKLVELGKYNITFIDSKEENIKRLAQGKSIRYSIALPSELLLPKMIVITVNDEVRCLASEYPPPSTRIEIGMTYTTIVNRSSVIGENGEPEFETESIIQSVYATASYIPFNCGRAGISGVVPFIAGGSFLTRGQFPWLAAIFQVESPDSDLKFICGGSLISSRTVVSAAHCFRIVPANEIVVHLGRHNLQNSRESGIERHEIESLLIHPEYNTWTPDADLAILTTKTTVGFSQYIQPICLWIETNEEHRIVGLMGTVAGWGGEDGPTISQRPKKATARIISRSDCVHRSNEFEALTSERTLCAGNRDGTGPCLGDSGSGLMIERYGLWMLRGIVSAGQTIAGKCYLGDYVIYSDVAKHMKWVAGNTLA